MENASKALIIAGAILLSILIIGLGMFIFNQAKNATSGIGLDKEKAQSYNDTFEKYFGDNKSGSDVRTLVDEIRSNDVSHIDDAGLLIALAGANPVAATENGDVDALVKSFNTAKSKIKPGKTYKVEGTKYDTKTGYLKEITITEN